MAHTAVPPATAVPEAAPARLRRPLLAVLAVALQAAPGLPGGHLVALRHGLVLASGVAVLAWFVANLRATTGRVRTALAVAFVGAAMNLAVMVPNGGMPVSAAALETLDAADADVADGHLYKHRLADDGTVLALLGDVLPVPALGMAASAGDAVLLVGILATAGALLAPRRRPT